MSAMDQLEPIEKASVDELRRLQLKRLRWSLKHAYEQRAALPAELRRRGVRPGDLKTLPTLPSFPFTTKADLRDNYPFGMFAAPMDEIVRVHASSGTTGKPIVVGYTKEDIATWSEVMARSIRAAGGRSTDIVQIAYGYGLFTGGLGAHYGAEALGATVIPMSGGNTERQIMVMRDFGATSSAARPPICSSSATVARQGMERGRSAAARAASSAPSPGPRACARSESGSSIKASTSTA